MARLMMWGGKARLVPKHVAYSRDDQVVRAAMLERYGEPGDPKAARAKKVRANRAASFQELDQLTVPVPAEGEGWPRGVKVYARGDDDCYGRATGNQQTCRLEGCRGKKVAVVWPDGRLTHVCTKGLESFRDGWRIL